MAVTYFNLLLTLEQSRAQLRPVVLPTREEELGEWLRGRRVPEHHAADAACEEFALTEGWPPIRTDDVLAQVHLRVLTAAQLCRLLSDRPMPAGWTRRKALQALLLDYWRSRVERWTGLGSEDNPGEGWLGDAGQETRGIAKDVSGFNLTQAE